MFRGRKGEMEELHVADDQSHYEISLTAGQAFAAFVLLLLSLAAAFAFGLMIGKGQADDRLVVQKETPVVSEASVVPSKKKSGDEGRIVELGVADDDFQETATAEPEITDTTESSGAAVEAAAVVEPVITEEAPPADAGSAAVATPPVPAAPRVTTYAQLLSTSDQKTAEALAAKLIDRGYTAAYVERGATDKGPIYRVRIKFNSETDARAAEPKLREFAKEVWITTK
jgi:hypothetical protein